MKGHSMNLHVNVKYLLRITAKHLGRSALCTQGGQKAYFRILIDGKSSVKFGLIHYLNHFQQNGSQEMKCK